MKISKKLVSAVLGINVKSIYVSCDIDDDNPAVSLDCGTYTRNINVHELAYETKLYVSRHNYRIESAFDAALLFKHKLPDRGEPCKFIDRKLNMFEPLAILNVGKKAHKLITSKQTIN